MSQYLVFIDESGDPNMHKIDMQYPVFGVGALIFEEEYFKKTAIPAFEELKKEHGFLKDTVFHSRDIRKRQGEFAFLSHYERRMELMEAISNFFQSSQMIVISSVIKKKDLKGLYTDPGCPYDLAFQFILERLEHFLRKKNATAHLTLERRVENVGPLNEVFYRLKHYGNGFMSPKAFQKVFPQQELSFVGKNNVGTQMADLAIYPLSTKILREGENKAFEVLSQKLYKGASEDALHYGFKIFP